MPAIDETYVHLIGTTHPDLTLWDDETDIEARDLAHGADVDADSRMILAPSGGAIGNPLQVMCERGGMPDAGARLVVRFVEGGDWIGWDDPTNIMRTTVVDIYGGSAPRAARMTMCQHGDGSLVLVSSLDPEEVGISARVYRRAPTTPLTAAWSYVGAFEPSEDPTTDYPANFGACPVLVPDDAGGTYLFVQRHGTLALGALDYRDVAQVDVWRVSGDADWSSGSPFEPYVTNSLRTAVVVEVSDSILAMAAGQNAGQALLVLATATTWYQYAGIIGDHRLVEEWEGEAVQPVCVTLPGYWILVYITAAGALASRRLGDASQPISGAVEVIIDEGSMTPDLVPAAWVDEQGNVFVIADKSDGLTMYRSDDKGLTWTSSGVVPILVAGTDKIGTAACAWRGRSVYATKAQFVYGYTNSIVAWDLGGWTMHATPPRPASPLRRLGYATTWLSHLQPISDRGNAEVTSSGTVTTSWVSGTLAYRVACGSPGTWRIEPKTVVGGNLKQYFIATRARVVSGSIGTTISGSAYSLVVTQTATAITVTDGISASVIATATISGLAAVRIWLDDTNGQACVWYAHSSGVGDVDVQVFIRLVDDHAMTAGTPGSTSFQTVVNAGATCDWHAWQASAGRGDVEWNPDVPYGRPVSARPVYVAGGVGLRGLRGPARVGDRWDLPLVSPVDHDRALATESYPSPRLRFESEDLEEGLPGKVVPRTIAWKIGAGEDPDPSGVTPLWLLWLESNAEQLTFRTHDGSAWSSGTLVKYSHVVTGNGRGSTVFADATTASSALAIQQDALAGGWIRTPTGGRHRILGNSAGLLKSLGTFGTQIVIRLEEPVDADFTGGTFRIVPRTSVAVVAPSARLTTPGVPLVKGVALTIADYMPPEGYWWLKAAIVPALVLGRRPGRDSRREFMRSVEVYGTRNGIRHAAAPAPAEEVVEVSWQSAPDVRARQMQGVRTSTPELLVDAHGNPLNVGGSSYGAISALVQGAGATTPIVYMPSWHIAGGSAYTTPASLAEAGLYMLEDASFLVEHAGSGEEARDAFLRGGSLRLRTCT